MSKINQYFSIVFNKTIIPLTLVEYGMDYSQLGTAHLVGDLSSHIQSACGIIVNYPSFIKLNCSYKDWLSVDKP